MISSKVVADSISEDGKRVTTLQLRYPRFIHEEFLTHRMFSRNAASSRAKPVNRWVAEIKEEPAYPILFGANKSGMQAGEEIKHKNCVKNLWNSHAKLTCSLVKRINDQYRLHKQHNNRLLHPFQHIDVVVTATEWENFFTLRDHKDAMPEIEVLAKAMKESMSKSEPVLLEEGEWHMPYVYVDDTVDYKKSCLLSAARCARVSYSNHDGTKVSEKRDLELAQRLLDSGHMSPFEHQATPMCLSNIEFYIPYRWKKGITHKDMNDAFWSGNFKNWIQYRQTL